MRKCPNCNKWELDIAIPKDSKEINDYYFKCWNCGFWCNKEEGEKQPSENITIKKI